MAVQLNPNTMHRRSEHYAATGHAGFNSGNAGDTAPSSPKAPDFYRKDSTSKDKKEIPTTLLNEKMHDGEVNCLELAIRESEQGDSLVFLEDRHNVDGNRAGHVLVRDGETGQLRDPSSDTPNKVYADLDAWNQEQRTNANHPDPYVASGEVEAGEVKKLMTLSPEQRREYVDQSGNADLQAVANDRFADTLTGSATAAAGTAEPMVTGPGGDEPVFTPPEQRALNFLEAVGSLETVLDLVGTDEFALSTDPGAAFAGADAERNQTLNEMKALGEGMSDLTSAMAALRTNDQYLEAADIESVTEIGVKYQETMKRLGMRAAEAQINTTKAVDGKETGDNAANEQAKLSKDWAIAGAVAASASAFLSGGTAFAGNSLLDATQAGLSATGATRAVWLTAQGEDASDTQVSALSQQELEDADLVINNMGGLLNEFALTNQHNGGNKGLGTLAAQMRLSNDTLAATTTAAGEEAIALSQLQHLNDTGGGEIRGVVDSNGFYLPEKTYEYKLPDGDLTTADPEDGTWLIDGVDERFTPWEVVDNPEVSHATAVLRALGYNTRKDNGEPHELTVWNQNDEQFDENGGTTIDKNSAGMSVWDESMGLSYGNTLDRVANVWDGQTAAEAAEVLWQTFGYVASTSGQTD